MTEDRLSQVKKAGFVLRPDSPTIKDIYDDVKYKFNSSGIDVLLSEESASAIGYSGVDFDYMCEECDFLVSLGGDGTLLSLVRKSYGRGKPVLGINAGNLGFLADVTLDSVPMFLKQLHSGEYRIDNRMMIEGYVEQDDGTRESFYALNDVVITRPTISKMSKIDAYINKEWFNTYRGDGLIVSTPTGSTAYNLATGGPMVHPMTDAFLLSPICASSLTQRPLVMPSDFTIRLKSHKDRVVVMVDGQDAYDMEAGKTLAIRGASVGAKMLHRKDRDYFSVLREKLSWGDMS